jgi:hypothetical protein
LKAPPSTAFAASLALALLLAGCGDDGPIAAEPSYLEREELMDPEACAGCHPKHYEEWSGSMHAYAADDPLFLAMNERGQREAGIGDFCVNCHAPMAVRTGATTDGLNLAELPQKLKGVTCYFCHSVDAVNGSHDNPLHLANDGAMRGAFRDPVANGAHRSLGSDLHDRDRLESASLCGACHDIVNPYGTHLERTYSEWQSTVFSQPLVGTTCGQCHMDQSTSPEPAANTPGVFSRRTHSHRFPAVDLPLTPLPGQAELARETQALLDTTLQSAVCVRGAGALTEIRVILDNVAAGHSFPSGAAQDRRAWVEVRAFAGDELVFESGVVPDGASVTELDDPNLWSIRDCLLDADGRPTHLFWEAADYESTLLPGQVTFDPADPRFYQSHVMQKYPRGDAYLERAPDRVSVVMKLLPFGLDVFDDLVDSGDLRDTDAYSVEELRRALVPFTVGAELEWTPQSAEQSFLSDGLPMSCVTNTALNYRADVVPATNHQRCGP